MRAVRGGAVQCAARSSTLPGRRPHTSTRSRCRRRSPGRRTRSGLAVPVGGSRCGGYYPVLCLCFGLAVRDALRGKPGFPASASVPSLDAGRLSGGPSSGRTSGSVMSVAETPCS
ncbi:DUF6302 family protein [Streptomyces kanamyceticus]|uniref:DUF6302 family protein n=1 Tax=Streptomyces kanamyceticus TaxID=1967 RepID=UPI0037DC12D9